MKRVICIILFIVTIATLTSCTANPTPITVECTCCCHDETSNTAAEVNNVIDGLCVDVIHFIDGSSLSYGDGAGESDLGYKIEYISDDMVKIINVEYGTVYYAPSSSISYVYILNKE